MADTIVNTPGREDSGAGWAVAVIILIAVIVGGVMWYRYYGAARPAAPDTTNVNVTIPNPLGADAGTPEAPANQ